MVVRHGLLLRLVAQGGPTGLGDAAPWPGFAGSAHNDDAAGERLSAIDTELVDWGRRLQAQPLSIAGGAARKDHGAFAHAALEALDRASALSPLARGALRTALLDLLGQAWGRPLAALLSPTPSARVPVHALCDSAYVARARVQAGYRALKLKVGAEPLDVELGRAAAIRAAVGPDVSLRLDANGAWSRGVAKQALKLFHAVHPAWVEQPVAADDLEGLAELTALNIVPIAVDESVYDSASFERVLAARAANGVVLKPAFLGGPERAMRLGEAAQAAGLDVTVTHGLDSAVGRLSALQVALALGVTSPSGLAGALSGDLAPALTVHRGLVAAPDGPGLGLSGASRGRAERWPQA